MANYAKLTIRASACNEDLSKILHRLPAIEIESASGATNAAIDHFIAREEADARAMALSNYTSILGALVINTSDSKDLYVAYTDLLANDVEKLLKPGGILFTQYIYPTTVEMWAEDGHVECTGVALVWGTVS